MKKHICIEALFILLLLVPAHAIAQSSPDTVDQMGTEVSCRVSSRYAFNLPRNTQIVYPQTKVTVGDFGVRDLLLETGEYLTVTLVPGPFTAQNGAPVAIPYTVDFNPPRTISERNIGGKYAITVHIAPDAIGGAPAGEYTAPLSIRVRSNTENSAVWRGTTHIKVIKSQESRGMPTPVVFRAAGPSPAPSPSPTAVPEETVFPPGEETPGPDEASPGAVEETIRDEPVPGGTVRTAGCSRNGGYGR